MRRVPRQQFLSGLSAPALKAVTDCEIDYRDWFVSEYHTADGIAELNKNLYEEIRTVQSYFASRDHILRSLEEIISSFGRHLRDSHKLLTKAEEAVNAGLTENENPHLRYLGCLEARESVAALTCQSKLTIDRLQNQWSQLDSVARLHQTSESTSQVVECPVDRVKLRVPSGKKRLLVTCSCCHYKFIVHTSFDVNPTILAEQKGRTIRLLKSLKAVFTRR
jgi:hypothetical protein